MRRGLVLAWLSLAWLLLACRRESKPHEAPLPPLAVDFAGCAAVTSGPVCELPNDRTLRVYVPGGTAATFSAPATELRSFPEGKLHRVVVPEGATELSVDKDGKRFVLRLAKVSPYPWVLEARARRAKDPEGARAMATPKLSSPDPVERALALGLVARLDLAKGDVDDAIARFREAMALETGRTSDRALDGFALAFALGERRRRYAEAQAVLDAVERLLAKDGDPEDAARLPFYRAEVSIQSGDVRAVLRGLRAARASAEHLGIVRLERNARGLLATVLQDLGDVEGGIATLRALDDELGKDPDATACERAETLLNLGLSIERRELSRSDLGEPVNASELSAPASRATAVFGTRDGCKDPHLRGIAYGLAASAALLSGKPDEAAAFVEKSRASIPVPRTIDVLQLLDLEARVAGARGDRKLAIEKHGAAIAFAEASQQTDMLWRALVGRGDALAATNDIAGALADYARAEALLDDVTLAIPLGELRGLYLSRSETSARRAISLLLAQKKDREAFAVARRARSRLLSITARATAIDALDGKRRAAWEDAVARFRAGREALDVEAEADWKLAAPALRDARAARVAKIGAVRSALDDAIASLGLPKSGGALSSPDEGELWIAMGRTREGWVAFAASSKDVRAVSFPAPSAASLLATFRTEISAAKRIAVLPYGPLRAIDVHALLVDTAPVVYRLDVPRLRAPTVGSTIGVVADPTEDLPAARAEAKSLSSLFSAHGGLTVRTLLGADATNANVSALVGSVALFHYAGHAVFGGPEGVESRLPLAGGTQLGLYDVLTAERVPRRVVLSACESSRSSLDAPVETLGLAQAFVLAGSEGVVAPTRKVPDALAARMSEALHRALLEGDGLPEALRRAQLALRDAEPTADWAAFRALEP